MKLKTTRLNGNIREICFLSVQSQLFIYKQIGLHTPVAMSYRPSEDRIQSCILETQKTDRLGVTRRRLSLLVDKVVKIDDVERLDANGMQDKLTLFMSYIIRDELAKKITE